MDRDLARLLGIHSLYHLCQISLLCPLVSLFSGRRDYPEDGTRGRAETITKHVVRHGQLIRDYIFRKQDISRLNCHVGFAIYVSTSIILTLLRSRARRHQHDEQARPHVSHELSKLVQDSIDTLCILQCFWKPLQPMVR